MSETEVIQGIRLAFDSRVTPEFCLTEKEVGDLLDYYPAEFILQALRVTEECLRNELKRGHGWQQEEIVEELKQNSKIELAKADSHSRRRPSQGPTHRPHNHSPRRRARIGREKSPYHPSAKSR